MSAAYAYPKISPGSETRAAAPRAAAEAAARTQHLKTAGQTQTSGPRIGGDAPNPAQRDLDGASVLLPPELPPDWVAQVGTKRFFLERKTE